MTTLEFNLWVYTKGSVAVQKQEKKVAHFTKSGSVNFPPMFWAKTLTRLLCLCANYDAKRWVAISHA